ncbi:MAG: 1-acyl-sn-glycerol-3-phosphate acyltransferase [Chloroflexi bacterium]|nr:1-acyl-sn-glycerol-3-phosphate acyltransferase [Chloroflexota bacterium]
MRRNLIRLFVKIVIALLTRIERIGFDNIPSGGNFIIAANHLGYLDAFIMIYLMNYVKNENPIVIVAEKYERYAVFRWAVRVFEWDFIDRQNAEMRTMLNVIKRLKAGGFMAIAPEGTRSKTEGLIEGKQGAAFLAAKSGAQVIPAGVIGSEDRLFFANLKRLRRTPIRVIVGDAFEIPDIPRENRDNYLQEQTDEIMCQIAALIPAKNRGVYKDHPRLKELIAEEKPSLSETLPA